jgi:hypothetical protein
LLESAPRNLKRKALSKSKSKKTLNRENHCLLPLYYNYSFEQQQPYLPAQEYESKEYTLSSAIYLAMIYPTSSLIDHTEEFVKIWTDYDCNAATNDSSTFKKAASSRRKTHSKAILYLFLFYLVSH